MGGDQVHTGQLYFDPSVTEAMYRAAPYASHGEPDTTNSGDGIYRSGSDRSTLALDRGGGGLRGAHAARRQGLRSVQAGQAMAAAGPLARRNVAAAASSRSVPAR